jgi:phosphomannomutase
VYWKDFTGYYLDCEKFLNTAGSKTRTIDCANGIGGLVFPHFAKIVEPHLKVNIINNDNPGKLNDHCGADFVKTTKQFPLNYKK